VAHHHNGSIAQALLDIFPNIGLNRTKLLELETNKRKLFHDIARENVFWQEPQTRRTFLEKYANENQFNFFSLSDWVSHQNDILSVKGITQLLHFHNGNIVQAVLDLFPEIRKDNNSDKKTRRNFFEDYAKKAGFDPLTPENWFQQSIPKLMSVKGIGQIINSHGGSMANALQELFPEMNIEGK